MSNEFRAVVLAWLLIASYAFAPVALHGGSSAIGTAQAGSNTSPNFEVIDVQAAGNTGGVKVVVEAQTSSKLDNFGFYYNASGDGTDRTNKLTNSNGGVTARSYPLSEQSTWDGISTSDSQPTRATFTLDSAEAPKTDDPIEINVTAGGTSYSNAAPANRDVVTANYRHITPQDSAGNAISGVMPFVVLDAQTNQSVGSVFFDGQSQSKLVYACRGAMSNGTCTEPKDGASVTVAKQDWSAGGTISNPSSPSFSSSIALRGYNLPESNATTRLDSTGATTAKSTEPYAPAFFEISNASQGTHTVSVDSVTVTNTNTGNVVFKKNGKPQAPVFLKPATPYKIEITNSGSYGTETRYLTVPTAGMTQTGLKVGATASKSTVTGQIVNASGEPVEDVVVVAEDRYSGGNGFRMINSTSTDSNGLFSMRLPQTEATAPEPGQGTRYKLTLVSDKTDGSTLQYYPTVHDNNGEGYKIRSTKTVIPKMQIKDGGELSIDVTQGGGYSTLQTGVMQTTLGKYTSRTGARTRSAASESFNQVTFGKSKPSSAKVSLVSPTTDASTRVNYNVWGVGTPTKWLCTNDVSVSQGSTTSSSCSLEEAGYIEVSVDEYKSIVDQANSPRSADTGSFGFFFENEVVIRDSSTGNVVTYLGPGSSQAFNLDGTDTAKIPVPAGSYELEVRPATEWTRQTTVKDSTSVSVSSGSTATVTLDRGKEFDIAPIRSRAPASLTRSANNEYAVNITDPVDERGYTAAEISSATVHFAAPNGTKVSDRASLSYNSTAGKGVFETKTLKPSDLGADAGTYDLIVTATHEDGTRTYNTTWETRVTVSGFQTGIDLSSSSVGPGDQILGRISAYDTTQDPPSAISANKNDVKIKVIDENGNVVTNKNPSSDVSNGEGTFKLSMPDSVGDYRVLAFVDSGSSQGIAERWVSVSKYQVSVETDKRTYRPDESVEVTVAARDSGDGSAVTDASVEVAVGNNRIGGTTDASGEFTTTLDPANFSEDGQSWSGDNFVEVEVLKDTDTGIIRKFSGTGFRVQSFDLRAEPVSRTYTSSENVLVDVESNPAGAADAVAVRRIDGEELESPVIANTQEPGGFYQLDLGTQPVGEHRATIAAINDSNGNVVETTVAFAVRDASIAADTDKFSYSPSEDITTNVTVRDTSGNAVSNKDVTARLYAAESPPRQVGSSASGTTGSDGTVSITGLSASSPGPHFVEVEVDGQTARTYLGVSDLSVAFEDGNGNAVDEYEVEPGDSKTVNVSATAGGSDVADGAAVDVGVFAYGEIVDEANGEVSGGDGTATLDINVPSDVPKGSYTLATRVRTTDGNAGTTDAVLNVTGGNALSIEADPGQRQYEPGETGTFTASVTDASGAPVSGETVVFTIDTEGAAETKLGEATTGADGTASVDHTLASDATSGEYVLKTHITDKRRTQDYNGFLVTSLETTISADASSYAPGDTISLTVDAVDTAGNNVDADRGELRVVMPSGNEITQSFSTSGTAPYTPTFTIPDDSSSVGSVTISAGLKNDAAVAVDSTLTEVVSEQESANITVPETVTAGESTDVTLSSSTDAKGTLTVFSPGASSPAVERSVSLSAGTNSTESVTLPSAGTYVFKLSVPDVGTVTRSRNVAPVASGSPALTVGTGIGQGNETFNTTEDLVIQTDRPGATATVVSGNESYTVRLNQQRGSTYYGVLSEKRSDGVYLVRLDTPQATAVNETLIEVGP
ncbi:hypothetical protein [Haloarcula amylolytica]|uniref:hypothetical protein n=1 Tax=Haloarcula amylolytica TaxID=396317 RepID=UPI003C79399F